MHSFIIAAGMRLTNGRTLPRAELYATNSKSLCDSFLHIPGRKDLCYINTPVAMTKADVDLYNYTCGLWG